MFEYRHLATKQWSYIVISDTLTSYAKAGWRVHTITDNFVLFERELVEERHKGPSLLDLAKFLAANRDNQQTSKVTYYPKEASSMQQMDDPYHPKTGEPT